MLEADDLVALYPDQRVQCAEALKIEGYAYYKLRHLTQARQTFNKILREFKEQKNAVESAREGLRGLDAVEKGHARVRD